MPGNVIRVKSDVNNVRQGTRYYCGLVLGVYSDPDVTQWNGVPEVFIRVLWADGHIALENFKYLSPCYEVIDEAG